MACTMQHETKQSINFAKVDAQADHYEIEFSEEKQTEDSKSDHDNGVCDIFSSFGAFY